MFGPRKVATTSYRLIRFHADNSRLETTLVQRRALTEFAVDVQKLG